MTEYTKMMLFLLGLFALAVVTSFTCDGCTVNITQQQSKEDSEINEESQNISASDVNAPTIKGGIEGTDIHDARQSETTTGDKAADRRKFELELK